MKMINWTKMLKLLSFGARRVQIGRPLSSEAASVTFRKSIKAQRASLLKLLDDDVVPNSTFASMLADASSIKDKNLVSFEICV
jgi:hypothetical protein